MSLCQTQNHINMKRFELITKSHKTKWDFPTVTSSDVVAEVAKSIWSKDIDIRESFYCLYLNRANQINGYAVIATGGYTAVNVDVRMICKMALDTLSTGVILVHNHPSGNLNPSMSDIEMTKKINKALALFDIHVLDHVVITRSGHTSIL